MCRAQDRFWRTSFLMLLVLSTVYFYPWKTWPFKTLIRIWFLCGDKGLSHSALCEVKVTGRSTEGMRSLYMVSAPQERLPLTMFLFFCFQVCPLNVWASGIGELIYSDDSMCHNHQSQSYCRSLTRECIWIFMTPGPWRGGTYIHTYIHTYMKY